MTSSKTRKRTSIVTSQTRTKFQNFRTIEYRNYKTFPIFRGFEQLSNFVAWRVMMVQTWAISARRVALERFALLSVKGF